MVCKLWVQLVQDDDVRVPFGKAHEHARELVEVHSVDPTLLSNFNTNDEEHGDPGGPEEWEQP